MRINRAALAALALVTLAIPAAASAATAATTSAATVAATAPAALPLAGCNEPGPWVIGTSAVNIRSRATTSSTIVGVLYKSHRFTVHSSSGGWHYITDLTTGVKGWVSGTYVYRDVRMCLN
ncbi:SH3 domain protein [Streptomyces laurentii]|uniref:SH3 domain protein n=1 Tax=Streptomyces laurentii TaxID=39478 RepID=A0A160P9M2_STRLU|nr:SH3 domain protein [Streptomyces laurentii]